MTTATRPNLSPDKWEKAVCALFTNVELYDNGKLKTQVEGIKQILAKYGKTPKDDWKYYNPSSTVLYEMYPKGEIVRVFFNDTEEPRKHAEKTFLESRSVEEHQRSHQRSVEEYRRSVEEHHRSVKEDQRSVEEHWRSVEEHQLSAEEHQHSVEEHWRSVEEHQLSAEDRRRLVAEHQRLVEEHRHSVEEYRHSVEEHRQSVEDHRYSVEEYRRSVEEHLHSAEERRRLVAEHLCLVEEHQHSVEEHQCSVEKYQRPLHSIGLNYSPCIMEGHDCARKIVEKYKDTEDKPEIHFSQAYKKMGKQTDHKEGIKLLDKCFELKVLDTEPIFQYLLEQAPDGLQCQLRKAYELTAVPRFQRDENTRKLLKECKESKATATASVNPVTESMAVLSLSGGPEQSKDGKSKRCSRSD